MSKQPDEIAALRDSVDSWRKESSRYRKKWSEAEGTLILLALQARNLWFTALAVCVVEILHLIIWIIWLWRH